MIEVSEETMTRIHTILSGIEGAKGKILRPAFGRAMQAGKTEAKRQALATYHIKSSEFNSATRIVYKGITDNHDEIVGNISFSGYPIKLIRFHVTPTTPPKRKKAPSANVLEANAPVKFNRKNDVFVQQMTTGHIGIFKREDTGKIKELYGPSGPKMIENEKVMQAIEDKVNKVINRRIDHEINRLLNGGG